MPKSKSKLDIAWVKIEDGLHQETEGKKLWIEGTLELISILDDARKRLGSDQAFGKWLSNSGYGPNRITRHERSALLNMAADLNVTREVLEQTHRRSWRHIWEEEVHPRLPHVGQPTDGMGPEAPTRRPKRRNPTKREPWVQDTKGWFNQQIERVNAVINELNIVMEKCEPKQHKRLATLETALLSEAFRKGAETSAEFEDWVATPLEKATDKLVRAGRVRVTPPPKPVRRAAAQDQPSA
jgi:hypothetical protein